MKKFILFISIFLALISCKSPKIWVEVLDLSWKNKAIEIMSKRYSSYMQSRLNDTLNNYATDIYYKIADINRYPFGIGFDNLIKEIESKKINFDSIICITKQSTKGFNPDYLYPNYYYIFKGGKLVKVLIFDAESLRLTESDDSLFNLEEMFFILNKKKDWIDQSLLIFTTILPDSEYKVSKIVINSY